MSVTFAWKSSVNVDEYKVLANVNQSFYSVKSTDGENDLFVCKNTEFFKNENEIYKIEKNFEAIFLNDKSIEITDTNTTDIQFSFIICNFSSLEGNQYFFYYVKACNSYVKLQIQLS